MLTEEIVNEKESVAAKYGQTTNSRTRFVGYIYYNNCNGSQNWPEQSIDNVFGAC
jgi:hypothetical protein